MISENITCVSIGALGESVNECVTPAPPFRHHDWGKVDSISMEDYHVTPGLP